MKGVLDGGSTPPSSTRSISYKRRTAVGANKCVIRSSMLLMGLYMVSTGQRVRIWTTRQAIDVNEAKLVNAKASTKGTVKVTVSKTAFFGRQAANDSAVLLAA